MKTKLIILGIAAVLLIVTGYHKVINRERSIISTEKKISSTEDSKQTSPIDPASQTSVQPTVSSASNTTGLKTYKNNQYGFEFKYPAHLDVAPEPPADSYSSSDGGVIIYDPKNQSTRVWNSYNFSISIHKQPVRHLTRSYTDPYEFAQDYWSHSDYSQTEFLNRDAAKIFPIPDTIPTPTGYIIIEDGLVYMITWPSSYPAGEEIAKTLKFI